ncbi:MAG TPA: sigma 54-interacting transcriptional regulator, partial [Vicinamibacterales bacterium]
AHRGTVFMDEVGETSPRMQGVLLRFLEQGEIQRVGSDAAPTVVDVRVIAATNRQLIDSVAAKTFREDLYYRLNVIQMRVPPLRERREDIAPFLDFFLRQFTAQYKVPQPTVSPAAMNLLCNYAWPGNVRELRNVVERLVVRSSGGEIEPRDLPIELLKASCAEQPAAVASPSPVPGASVAAKLFDRMVNGGESLWDCVYAPFMARDLTRDDVRAVVIKGLERTSGNYKVMMELFNMPPGDYKRFLGFLRKYQCHMPFQNFRSASVTRAASASSEHAQRIA